VAGLCYELGFLDKNSFAEQAERGEGFSGTVKKARLKIESMKNEMLLDGRSPAGVIFDLKNNHGWADKQEIEHSGAIQHTRLPQKKAVGADVDLHHSIADNGN
jgi:hypothetical protein